MKGGTGDDPFSDELDETDGSVTEKEDVDADANSAEQVETDADDDGTEAERVPWAVRRNSVKSEREMVQFYFRERTQERESEFRRDVEADAGFSTYLTDVREAAYLVAMEHPEEVAELLEDWGCEYD
ncbi:hypothetical protein [Halomicrococcus sp. NG-SE-24]|uniref:hypothetical protein n=1 Tax=Halomicrococcus sp. NG-SE-24 TaxID=3436928 RepID=UPI003D972690